MSYFLGSCNLVVATILVALIYDKYTKLLTKRSIKEVLFSNVRSACCTQRSNNKINNCESRYCLKKNLDRIIELINSSKYTISLAMFRFKCEDLKEALVNAHNRGIKIKIVANKTITEPNTEANTDFQKLLNAGIVIRFLENEREKLLHHKFCLMDTEKDDAQKLIESELPEQGVLLTGSMNWTLSSFCSNWDNIVVTSNEDLIQKYQTEYNAMWRRLRHRSGNSP